MHFSIIRICLPILCRLEQMLNPHRPPDPEPLLKLHTKSNRIAKQYCLKETVFSLRFHSICEIQMNRRPHQILLYNLRKPRVQVTNKLFVVNFRCRYIKLQGKLCIWHMKIGRRFHIIKSNLVIASCKGADMIASLL